MKLNHFNDQIKIEENSYIWRYVSYLKLYDLLFNKNIYFTRIDNFHDPLEGLDIKTRFLLHLKNISKDSEETNPIKRLVHSENADLFKVELEKWQKGIFANCWFLSEFKHSESLAMWDLYCDSNGFVVKIPIEKFNDVINDSLKKDTEYEIVKATYGKIEYLEYHEHPSVNEEKLIMPAFVKHNSYAHENEMRYLLLWDPEKRHEVEFIKLNYSDSFEKLKRSIKVIAHPNMDENLYDLYSQKLKEIEVELTRSELLTKKNISELLK